MGALPHAADFHCCTEMADFRAPAHPSKQQLRRTFLSQRRGLSATAWQAHSQHLCDRLTQLPLLQQARTILAYQSIRQEPDLTPLFSTLAKDWGLPRCVGKTLQWHRWRWGEPLVQGQYGIGEPDPALPRVEPSQVDLILVPCVACDRAGYRLGYGGGYYDRFCADPQWQGITAIGLLFESAYVDTLPHDPWDVPLSGVCTESGYHAAATLPIPEDPSP
ncbi:5-formyltetrahydrofolate cyclo-ligase [Spirulina major CS-329]|uniref:5-formyltetrahydrofolate cyclo-ligase n=1 Tax=Spirulina TaxID=1154 RepID=UPI00232BC5D0|nr:5-formyltetrahydrofolate cyclo-ligase [Spirulina major]MDB9504979.1 5-formyltetrahydrofolate cyclo-ligase [Spirulina major CS-329]